jgi:peptidyl-prolyl cis-trans isomerase B (cyclophilin B)
MWKWTHFIPVAIVSTIGSILPVAALETSIASFLRDNNSPKLSLSKSALQLAETPKTFPGLPRLNGKATVVMKIEKRGTITIEVDGTNAPISAGNFVDLVQRGFYNGLTFHRVIRQPQPFVVQGGDPKGTGTGGYIPVGGTTERRIPLEIKPQGAKTPIYSETITNKPQLRHKRGAIAMARSQEPDSASSQFYFALTNIDFLDGNYAVFGNITQGLKVIDRIEQGDKIISAKVTKGAKGLKVDR